MLDPRTAQQEEALKAHHRIASVSGVSGAAIAYDYKPCQAIAVREVAIGGRRECRCIARRDNFLFVGVNGGGVAVLDVADPRLAPIVSTLALPGAEIIDFALVGTTLYAADFLNGLHAIDVADPKQPRHVASHPALSHTNNRRVVASANLLVLINDQTISIFDIAQPGQLRPVALHHRMRTAVGWLRGIALDGNRLHVTQGPMGLWTFDVSDPTKLHVIGGLEPRLDTRPNERLICDSLAQLPGRVVVGTSSGVWVLNAGDGQLVHESFFTGPGTVRDTARGATCDGLLYFCAFEPHDHVFHIFDPKDGVRYMGRQRLSRMIDRIYDLDHGPGYWIGAAGNAGVLFASY